MANRYLQTLRGAIAALIVLLLGACTSNPTQTADQSDAPASSTESKSVVEPPAGQDIDSTPCDIEGPVHSSRHRGFSTYYPSGLEADAEIVSAYVSDAIDALRPAFTATTDSDSSAIDPFDVCIHAQPTAMVREGLVTLSIRGSGNDYRVSLHMLAPSRHEHAGTTLMGEPFDERYFQRVVTHEVGTLYLLEVVRSKPAGWSFDQAPAWFSEGYQEYLALNFSTDHARRVTQKLYLETVERSPNRVRLELSVENPYVDGAVLMRFLHERYGADALRAVLTSEQPDFWSAMKSVLGLTPQELDREFSIWMASPANRANATGQ